MTQRHYRPVIVELDGDMYEIHTGAPGKPRVYRRRGSSHRRIKANDPILPRLARAFREGVDERQAAEAAELERRSGWRYRTGRWFARLWVQLTRRRPWPWRR